MHPTLLSRITADARARGATTALLQAVGPAFALSWPDGGATPLSQEEGESLVQSLADAVFGPEQANAAFRDGLIAWIGSQGLADASPLAAEPLPRAALKLADDAELHAATVPGGIRLVWHTWDDVPALDALGEAEALNAALNQPYGLLIVAGADPKDRRLVVDALARELIRLHTWYIADEAVSTPRPGLRNVVGPAAQLTGAIRSALRWDPDVLVVPTPDAHPEAWTMAVQAALTGHLVILGTDGAEAIAALRRADVENYLLAASIRAIVEVGPGPRVEAVRMADDAMRAALQAE